jgi:hypothetical protein
VNTSSKIICTFCVLLLCLEPTKLSGQSTMTQKPNCFSVRVSVNGKRIQGPEAITFKTKQKGSTASLEGGCFRVPQDLLRKSAVDVSFDVPGNRVHLTAISMGFFAGSWDVNLEDKKFGKEVSFPKRANTREGCAVVFHIGEPETEISQTNCRSRIPAK